jgi:type I restriction enzyme S subunit
VSFSCYLEYKDTGVEWLGLAPAHWSLKRLKQVFSERDERSSEGEETLLSVSAYTGVSPRSEIISSGDHLSRAESLEGYKVCFPNDLVVNIMLAWNRGLGFSRFQGIVSPAYCVYRVIDDSEPAFLDYLVRSDQYILYFKAFSSGVIDSRLRIYPDVFGRLFSALPPTDEQHAIVAFLDRETTKIDTLVAEQEKLIELLKEKRQALISHTVTKGLDPKAPMKDSGIEWLSDVPAHWKLSRLKYVAHLIIDCPHETPIYDADGDYLVIRTADVEEGDLDSSKMYRLSEEQFRARTRRQSLLSNDLVYGREGERWGHAALVPESDRYCLGQRMMQFRLGDGHEPQYMMWQLNAISTYRQGEVDTVGATSPHVNVSTIRNYRLAEPAYKEQAEIAVYLAVQTVSISALAREADHAIELLKERRSALISAAVTGKIDVRGLTESTNIVDLMAAAEGSDIGFDPPRLRDSAKGKR